MKEDIKFTKPIQFDGNEKQSKQMHTCKIVSKRREEQKKKPYGMYSL